ncbi:4Fe-4S dicluster domain-containing protein [Desulfatibacillum aliphaticivorans]|uniref:4Fe-4S dicluster domain-containing protein n=1 Tax=Desulfatibacillum aliphaticivorans TaxID=218208 RepID=UPI00040E8319|nr:4Fe-4S dicluster domain-containing protein [Desulfatibacillum aliphaticivorans]
MLNTLTLISLAVFVAGGAYKVGSWFGKDAWEEDKSSFLKRLAASVVGLGSAFFSLKLLVLVKVFFLDVLFQRKILRQSLYRWVSHMMIFWGFIWLLAFHALGSIFAEPLFGPDYICLNPLFFLRELTGLMVLAGLSMAFCRRICSRQPRMKTGRDDLALLALLILVMLSGFLLESVKISSHYVFMDMVENWAGLDPDDDAEDILALRVYWEKNNALASAGRTHDPGLAEDGFYVHESYCMSCHVSNKWAPAGYLLAKAIGPAASRANGPGAVSFFYWLHVGLCLAGLASLPFTKLFHVFSTPLSLLINSVTDWERVHPANAATIRAIELDACVHCSACNLNESMAVLHSLTGNDCILPSEKIRMLKGGLHKLTEQEKCTFGTGLTLCTCCDKCSNVCPAGIQLKQIWKSTRGLLFQQKDVDFSLLSPLSFHPSLSTGIDSDGALTGLIQRTREAASYGWSGSDPGPIKLGKKNPKNSLKSLMDKTLPGATAARCMGCEMCTNACPVPGLCDNPAETLGLMPSQIIRAIGLGRVDMALGAGMLWSCLSCYRCQDVCPAGVQVADALIELRNIALNTAGAEYDSRSEAADSCPAKLVFRPGKREDQQ